MPPRCEALRVALAGCMQKCMRGAHRMNAAELVISEASLAAHFHRGGHSWKLRGVGRGCELRLMSRRCEARRVARAGCMQKRMRGAHRMNAAELAVSETSLAAHFHRGGHSWKLRGVGPVSYTHLRAHET